MFQRSRLSPPSRSTTITRSYSLRSLRNITSSNDGLVTPSFPTTVNTGGSTTNSLPQKGLSYQLRTLNDDKQCETNQQSMPNLPSTHSTSSNIGFTHDFSKPIFREPKELYFGIQYHQMTNHITTFTGVKPIRGYDIPFNTYPEE